MKDHLTRHVDEPEIVEQQALLYSDVRAENSLQLLFRLDTISLRTSVPYYQ